MKFFYLWSSAWPCPSLLALILIFLTNVTIVKTEETSVQVCHMIMALETWRQWKTIIHNDGSKLQLLTPHNYIAYCVSHNFAPTAWIILSYWAWKSENVLQDMEANEKSNEFWTRTRCCNWTNAWTALCLFQLGTKVYGFYSYAYMKLWKGCAQSLTT